MHAQVHTPQLSVPGGVPLRPAHCVHPHLSEGPLATLPIAPLFAMGVERSTPTFSSLPSDPPAEPRSWELVEGQDYLPPRFVVDQNAGALMDEFRRAQEECKRHQSGSPPPLPPVAASMEEDLTIKRDHDGLIVWIPYDLFPPPTTPGDVPDPLHPNAAGISIVSRIRMYVPGDSFNQTVECGPHGGMRLAWTVNSLCPADPVSGFLFYYARLLTCPPHRVSSGDSSTRR